MNKITTDKLPLEERLNRVSRGVISPRLIKSTIDEFCYLPIVSVLESTRSYELREHLAKILKSGFMEKYGKNSDISSLTVGDLADSITAYLEYAPPFEYDAEPGDEISEEENAIYQLAGIYMYCIDLIHNIKYQSESGEFNAPLTLEDALDKPLKPIFRFLQITLEDYRNYVEICSHKMYVGSIDMVREQTGMSDQMSMLQVFDELKFRIWGRDAMFRFGIEENEIPLFYDCRTLYEFFVYPIAMIMRCKQ